ncbi:MAG: PepSY domain-containing protein, partial [Firmicutes bacterium]|nr:PepSY domain-containing protein [Bacillota bacterium]
MRKGNVNVEESLRKAVTDMTPDMREQLLSELNLDPTKVSVRGKTPVVKKRRKLYMSVASCAAALMLIVGGSFLMKEPQAFAFVDLDVNPSIEMSVDNKARVISAEAVNEEGKDILAGMDMKGSDITVACNAVVGAMLTKGYLTDTDNSILVSVRSTKEAEGRTMEQDLSKQLNTYLDQSQITGAVMGQYVQGDEELEAFARQNGISEGKAWLIRGLMASDPRLTKESLLKLSTQDLILLCSDKEIKGESLYGTVNTSRFITKEKALAIALENAGINESDVTYSHAYFDCDDGVMIYEVDFKAGGREYDYEIDATTGEVIQAESEVDDDVYQSGGGNSGGSSSGGNTNRKYRDYDDDDDDDR